ncbi:hypothetical protein K6168_09870 [Streptomyces sp. FB2]|uniref:hypothetical protein n=1 Tax=Streptomyces sp. FB2 TaxID=2902454 RepID=UPI001F485DB4|nr:hypothetical protein [Streptomyces sp. FB2]MCF2535980.1 hypothetical protein [Streptomyces sp. FB2]
MRSSCRPTFLNFCSSPPIWNSCVTGAPAPLHALWGQSQANLTEVLGLRTNAGTSRAHQRIADAARRRFALSDVAAVHATVESGTAAGKVVIDVS